MTKIAESESGSTPKCHGSGILVLLVNSLLPCLGGEKEGEDKSKQLHSRQHSLFCTAWDNFSPGRKIGKYKQLLQFGLAALSTFQTIEE
jgi:hypothetical protein